MAQAEFEFWKIDSAFEEPQINAVLDEGTISNLIEKELKLRAQNEKYDLETLKASFKNFGWSELLPFEYDFVQKGYVNSKDIELHFTKKLGEELKKYKKSGVNEEKLLATIYFAYKTTELLKQETRHYIKISSLKERAIKLLTVANYFFSKKQRPNCGIYTSVLVALVYATTGDLSECREIQKKIIGYRLMGGGIFHKEISGLLVELLQITATSARVRKRGKYVTQLYYTLPSEGVGKLCNICSELKINVPRHSERYRFVYLTFLAPFKIMMNYFGIKGELNESVIKQLFFSLRPKVGLQKNPPKLSDIFKFIKEKPELSLEEITATFGITKAELDAYLEQTKSKISHSLRHKHAFYVVYLLVLIKSDPPNFRLSAVCDKVNLSYGEARTIVRELETLKPPVKELIQHPLTKEMLKLLPALSLLKQERGASPSEVFSSFGISPNTYVKQVNALRELAKKDGKIAEVLAKHEVQVETKEAENGRLSPLFNLIKERPELSISEVAATLGLSQEEAEKDLEKLRRNLPNYNKPIVYTYCLLEGIRQGKISKLTTKAIQEGLKLMPEDVFNLTSNLKQLLTKNEKVREQVNKVLKKK